MFLFISSVLKVIYLLSEPAGHFSVVPIFGERLSVSRIERIQVGWLFGEKIWKEKDFPAPHHPLCDCLSSSLLHPRLHSTLVCCISLE